MHNGAFQLNKVRRIIKTQGASITAKKYETNGFGEPTGEPEIVTIPGLFHEATAYASTTGTEDSTVRKKSSPMFMCMWEDIAEILHLEDEVVFNNKTYRINEIKNLSESNIIADISLEEVQT